MASTASEPTQDTIPSDLAQLLATARNDRAKRQAQINEYLRFADPSRPRIGDSQNAPTDRAGEEDDLFDATLQEVHEDFTSDLVALAMPRTSNWVSYEPEDGLPDEIVAQIKDPLEARTKALFSAIAKSNFYDEAATEWAGDLAHGTGAMWGDDPGKGQPLRWEAIPPGQLLIVRGMYGGLSFKAREWSMPLDEAMAFWKRYRWPQELIEDSKDDQKKRRIVTCVASATRIYDAGYDEAWQWRVCVDNKLIKEEKLRGRGCCSIIVTRWRSHSSSAWGIGPGLKVVPDARTLDQERYLVLKNLGKIVDPIISYEEDGVTNVEGGINAGDWVPRLTGTKVPEAIGTESRMDLAYFEEAGLQDKIRRGLFQYGPRQRGKTPPTLGQWMDEKNEEGRRLESPAAKIYAEGVFPVLYRTEYLLVKRGELDPVLMAADKAIKVTPLSPIARQTGSAEVATGMQLWSAIQAGVGPQLTGAIVDVAATVENMKKKLNDEIVVLRPVEQANQFIGAALGMEQNPDAAGGGGGEPPPEEVAA